MGQMLRRGRYTARRAETAADLAAAQRLRHLCFVEGAGRPARPGGQETDAFDARCHHVLVEEEGGRLAACFRLLPLGSGAMIGQSYSAQFYDLARLEGFGGAVVELGRFCLHPQARDSDLLRIAWGAIAAEVDRTRAGLLFGCSSFRGAGAGAHAAALAMLAESHLAPPRWRPGIKAPRVVRFGEAPRPVPDRRRALGLMPPLLRSYLGMGGWVSDHAVVDAEFDTLHVFTGLEIAAIPPARARALRAISGTCPAPRSGASGGSI